MSADTLKFRLASLPKHHTEAGRVPASWSKEAGDDVPEVREAPAGRDRRHHRRGQVDDAQLLELRQPGGGSVTGGPVSLPKVLELATVHR